MLKVDVRGLDELKASVDDLAKRHVPFAAARALTQVAENARMDTVREIRQKLHAPTEFTINSIFKKPATKQDLSSMVYVKDFGRVNTGKRKTVGKGQAEVLGHLFSGGSRAYKGFEAALMRIGVLNRGEFIVPGEGAPLDGNGNIQRGFIMQMISYFGANLSKYDRMDAAARARFGKRQGKKVGIGGAAVEYFISRGKGNWFGSRSWKNGRLQNLPPGIWMRAQTAYGTTAIKPIIMFVRKTPNYQRYFDLEAIARTAVRRDFDTQFHLALEGAMRTAGRLPGDSTPAQRSADYWAMGGW